MNAGEEVAPSPAFFLLKWRGGRSFPQTLILSQSVVEWSMDVRLSSLYIGSSLLLRNADFGLLCFAFQRPIWAFPGWKRLWRHCAKSAMGGGRGHHNWGHRRGGPPGPHRGCPSFRGCPATQAAGPSTEGGATAQDPTHAARAQYHELLNGIGDTIANLLDPLGELAQWSQ